MEGGGGLFKERRKMDAVTQLVFHIICFIAFPSVDFPFLLDTNFRQIISTRSARTKLFFAYNFSFRSYGNCFLILIINFNDMKWNKWIWIYIFEESVTLSRIYIYLSILSHFNVTREQFFVSIFKFVLEFLFKFYLEIRYRFI